MSYDVYFFKSKSGVSDSKKELDSFFASAVNYQCEKNQYIYDNKDTGVYFIFNYENPKAYSGEEKAYLESMETGLLRRTGLTLSVNLFRPRIFGLEAEKEAARLCAQLDLKIIDPQQDEKHRDVTSPEFLDSWIQANASGCKAILNGRKSEKELKDLSVHSMPSVELARLWSWNYEKADYQETLGEEIYVPNILPVLLGGKPCSCVVWTDAISEAIPMVDYVAVLRAEIRKQRLPGENHEICLVKMADLGEILSGAERVDRPIPHYLLRDLQQDEKKISILQSFSPIKEKINILPWDKILDEEDARDLI